MSGFGWPYILPFLTCGSLYGQNSKEEENLA